MNMDPRQREEDRRHLHDEAAFRLAEGETSMVVDTQFLVRLLKAFEAPPNWEIISTIVEDRAPAPTDAPVLERHRRQVLQAMTGLTDDWLDSPEHASHLLVLWMKGEPGRVTPSWGRLCQLLANAEAQPARWTGIDFASPTHPVLPDTTMSLFGLAGAVEDVGSFHSACGVPVLAEPSYPQEGRAKLRLDLTLEEFLELAEAMGVHEDTIYRARALDWEPRLGSRSTGDPIGEREVLCAVADALVDKIYIDIGTALEFGLPLARVWRAVHAANMAKAGPDGKVKRRADGKVLKPDGWRPPDVEAAIFGKAER